MLSTSLDKKSVKLISTLCLLTALASPCHAAVESLVHIRGDSGGDLDKQFGDEFALAEDDHLATSSGSGIGGGSGALVTLPGEAYGTVDYYVEGHQYNSAAWGFSTLQSTFTLEDLTITTVPAEIPGGPQPGATTQFGELHMSLNGFFTGKHYFQATSMIPGENKTRQFFGDGVLAVQFSGETFSSTLSIGHYFPLNSTFDLKVILQNRGVTDYFNPGEANGGSNEDEFGHLLQADWSVILGGSPAFIMPDGYYVNSADGRIVNNYFVSSVPLPPAVFLLGSSLMLFLGSAKRRLNR